MIDKDTIKELGNTILAVQKETARQTLFLYKSEVDRIIRTKENDIDTIEHTLDALGETAYNDEVLLLLRRLCRYYWDIDPVSTATHINWYRKMWDDSKKDKTLE